MLEFSVSNQLLTRLDATQVYSDSENYLECAFQFSGDWEGLTAVATFGHSGLAEPISVRIADGVCRVPHEVIHPYGFTLAVYGSGEEEGTGEYTHIPTNAVTVEVGEAGAAMGLSAPPPTANLYDSLLQALRDCEAGVEEAGETAAAASESAAQASQDAVSARDAALDHAERADGARLEALESAQGAQQAAVLTQELANQVSRNAGEVAAARQEVRDSLLLLRSYTMGTAPYAAVVSFENITWEDGEAREDLVGLQENKRYVVEVDGARYDAVSSTLPQMVIPGGSAGPVATLASFEDEGETSETPPGGGGDDPAVTPPENVEELGEYRRQVWLTAGPVVIRDATFTNPTGGRAGECILTTADPGVTRVTIVTDGHDNGRYYMEEARAARDTAVSMSPYRAAVAGGYTGTEHQFNTAFAALIRSVGE